MAKSQFFNTVSAQNEQRLIDSLISESISIMGENILYLPRKIVDLDEFFLEDISKYESSFVIEAYSELEDFGFGNTDFFTKFGIQNKDRIVYIIARNTFERIVLQNGLNAVRPLEGDLIYNIQSSELFQIKHVENENPYKMLGAVQTYKITCEAYKYSHQKITVPDEEIDLQINQNSKALILHLVQPIVGDFIVNEQITSGTTTAKVVDYNALEGTLTVIDRNGTFVENASVVGASSGVSGIILSFKTTDDPNHILDINLFLQESGSQLITNKKSNITGEIITSDFMSSF
jgi:hypothetical protein